MNRKRTMIDPLPAEDRRRSAGVQVWIVSWELPDKSWEAVCLSEEMAAAECQRRKNDSLVTSWGSVQCQGPMTLEAWYDGHTRHNSSDASTYVQALQDVLSPDSERSPVIVRTW
ncbi:MAG: hypothetical protein A3H45_01610 [Ignavibacteria bacterium RIFCSPLOWO2_02_FULL_55_14]|nr:MAG: hypothetical protein A3C56_00870 [Ignavibacteria bacterium RIFCSPHIGHO2_02_FULL_56_12]OGU69391.1 MAG: hypothetical protein A3H45_01610 [Ignavibacteria bacterium RIFCSPLOWO2_02_FULL_55_14]OGU72427.1 MAG: hypothetical protein A3G43_07775 [Ignavibacteria bacterium RIFCSPLOWO2_12_FULL_56_21]HAV23800.1 hypothetical protein [Bacteroidota bacterium]